MCIPSYGGRYKNDNRNGEWQETKEQLKMASTRVKEKTDMKALVEADDRNKNSKGTRITAEKE